MSLRFMIYSFSQVLQKKNIFQQHGFLWNRSTRTNLVSFEQYILEGQNEDKQTDAIFTDFSKAFNKVNHERLLQKLSAISVDSDSVQWFRSYLTNRTQTVRIKTYYSRDINVTSGVPQGSHLGPILFLIFINDITVFFKYVKAKLFADDLGIYANVRSLADAMRIQDDLKHLKYGV